MPAVAVVDVQVNSQSAVRSLERVNTASKTAQTSVSNLQGAITKLAGSFAAISAARFVFAKTAELESQTKSLQVLTGSVQQAKQIIEELQQLGAVTPFTSTELIDAAKRLQAFGVEGSRVVEITRRLADASGATGAELQGLVTAYGQVVAKGRLQGEELLQFQERGVGVQQELQKMYKLSGEELQKALSKGQISAKAVEIAFERLTSQGGKYANGAIAQSDTLSGKLSTLQDGVDALARRLGQVLTPALKAIFNQAIAVIDAINRALAAGRGGGFTRSVGGARQFLNVGATSQAVDNIAKGIGQVTSQRNRSGIEQNLQALQQYQRLLQSIGPDDPNSDRAVQLQGTILQKIQQNIKAQKELNQQTGKSGGIFDVPSLGAGAGAGAGAGRGRRTKERQSQISEIEAANGLFRAQEAIQARIFAAEQARNTTEALRLQGIQRGVELLFDADEIQRSGLPLDEQRAKLRGIQDRLLASSDRTQREIAKFEKESREGYPAYVQSIASAGAGFSQNLVIIKEMTEQQKQQQQLADSISSTIGTGMTSAFDALIQGSQNFGDSLKQIASGVLIDIAKQLMQILVIEQAISAVRNLLKPAAGAGSFLPNIKFNPISFSGLNFRANGGSVMAGQGYLVGEKGPELFMPGRSGGIAPAGGFGGVGNIVVNVDASGTNVEGNQGQGKALGAVIGAAVQAELIKQKKPGGLLY